MTTKPRRHKTVERNCDECDTPYLAIVYRVKEGRGRFCSIGCANDSQRREKQESTWGFDKGKKYWDKVKWVVHWRDLNGEHVTTYAKWWWTLNVGEIPEGYCISYIDGDSKNIDPSNFECIPESQAAAKGGKKLLGIPRPDTSGENCKWWKGGKPKEYPPEFSKRIKRKIKTRDNYTCQSCLCVFDSASLDVHHKDRDKYNNEDDNLITLCKSCHKAVHGKENKTNAAIEELKQLLNFPEGE